MSKNINKNSSSVADEKVITKDVKKDLDKKVINEVPTIKIASIQNCKGLNVRDNPNGNVIDIITSGQIIVIADEIDDEWVKVTYDNADKNGIKVCVPFGYCMKKYLNIKEIDNNNKNYKKYMKTLNNLNN